MSEHFNKNWNNPAWQIPFSLLVTSKTNNTTRGALPIETSSDNNEKDTLKS